MAATDGIAAIETLSERDIEAGLALSREAGWNQTGEDWRQFLAAGTVFGLRDDGGRLIATAALLPAPPVTWVSMVLVTQDCRRRGLADQLMRRCIAEAQALGLEPWLDATPAGATVYGRMGFAEAEFGLTRMRRGTLGGQSSAAREKDEARVSELLRQDRDALGFDRSPLLVALVRRDGSVIYQSGASLALVRDGDRARHIGPMFATDASEAITHLDRIITEERGPLLIDVSSRWTAVSQFLEGAGFAVERPFARMRLGASVIPTPGDRTIAAAGPEFG